MQDRRASKFSDQIEKAENTAPIIFIQYLNGPEPSSCTHRNRLWTYLLGGGGALSISLCQEGASLSACPAWRSIAYALNSAISLQNRRSVCAKFMPTIP